VSFRMYMASELSAFIRARSMCDLELRVKGRQGGRKRGEEGEVRSGRIGGEVGRSTEE
jgi:hypothetical protein